jgi:hypothetical protein
MPAVASLSHTRRVPRRLCATPLTLLFTRYLAGQIAEAEWEKISASLDALDADATERDALASYCLEAAATGRALDLPQEDEVEEFLGLVRN